MRRNFLSNLSKVCLLLLVVDAFAARAPGSASRPILTSSEAALYTTARYLQGWKPTPILRSSYNYLVGPGGYSTIQAAVNAAIKSGGGRKHIKISPGTYTQPVFIPSTNVSITIFGGGQSASDTVISLSLRAQTSPNEYKNIVNPGGKYFKPGDPAYSMFSSCATKSGIIGTGCTSIFWVMAHNVQISYLTIANPSGNAGDNQAVALQAAGDQIQVDHANIFGFQDTLLVGVGGNTVARSYFSNCLITGDIDFVFGGGTAVFEKCIFKARDARRKDNAVIFAPNTDPKKPYGYLIIGSTITGSKSFLSSKKVHLARAWDAGVSSASAYVPGTSPNGQLVIRETKIDGVINVAAPYAAATSGRAFSGQTKGRRNLNDNHYNRFWEYDNTGPGAP